jgi:hypothetical protein
MTLVPKYYSTISLINIFIVTSKKITVIVIILSSPRCYLDEQMSVTISIPRCVRRPVQPTCKTVLSGADVEKLRESTVNKEQLEGEATSVSSIMQTRSSHAADVRASVHNTTTSLDCRFIPKICGWKSCSGS